MKKKFFILLLLLLIPTKVLALQYPELNSKIVEIYDLNDQKILYEQKSTEEISIASLTKIATTITAIENIDNLDAEITITNDLLRTVDIEASVAGLKAGDHLTYRDLLYASMLPSGADATNSLAILSSGSMEAFVEKMNQLVTKLQLKHTHFANVTGLDDKDHYSTADEVIKLLEYALQNPTFKQIYTTREYTMSNNKTVKTTLYTYTRNNDIDLSSILGSKSGFTDNAGYCLSTLSDINGHEIIVLVLNAQKIGNTFYNIIDSVKLIDFLKNNYKEETILNDGEIIKEIKVNLSTIDSYKIYTTHSLIKYLPSDYNKDLLKIEYQGLEELDFNNKLGEKIGTITYYYNDERLSQEEVILNIEIPISIKKMIKKYYLHILGILFLLILFLILLIRKFFYKKKTKKTRN